MALKYRIIAGFGGKVVGELTLAEGFDPDRLRWALRRVLKAEAIEDKPTPKPAPATKPKH